MSNLSMLLDGFGHAVTPMNLLMAAIGVLVGTFVGVLPGLGPTSSIAILLPVTAVLEPTQAIIMLAGIYYGAMYGGSTTAILLNIPGEASSVPTCLDGYPLAQQGRGGPALGIAAIASLSQACWVCSVSSCSLPCWPIRRCVSVRRKCSPSFS